MTAEICIMNRHAVVLAADSATTVSRLVDGKNEYRYFKGANKIFQLSHHHPVGVMIFNSADLLRVPWELLIKDFRDNLDRKSFNSLSGYAEEFIGWLDSASRFFPDHVQKETFLDAANQAAIDLYLSCENVHRVEGDDGGWRDKIDDWLRSQAVEAEQREIASRLSDDKLRSVEHAWRADVVIELEKLLAAVGWPSPFDIGALADLAIRRVFTQPAAYYSTAGLVFAGFGDHDIFPGMIEYECAGLISGTAIVSRLRSQEIDHNQPAGLSAFAQTGMADTFQLGFSEDVYGAFMTALRECSPAFAAGICEKAGVNIGVIDDLDERSRAFAKSISEAVFERARRDHSFPLKQVLGFLPVDEMAELAETLVNLQSLKEKVTKPSASVGGPVDVAIITRNEGLVWVKRKKFFEADQNLRYTLRQQALHR